MAGRMDTDDTVILSVTNWTNSKASNDPDGGQSSLEGWLKRKAQREILASQRSGNVLQLQVRGRDKRSFLHINGWKWAGVDVTITDGQASEAPRGPRNQQGGFNQNQRNGDLSSRVTGGPNNNNFNNRNQSKELFNNAPSGPRGGGFQQHRQQNGNSSANPFNQASNNPFNRPNDKQQPADELTQAMIEVIRSRYNAADKFLNLSELATHPTIVALGLNSREPEKVFRVLFITLEQHVFETREKRAEMIESVSFAKNGLTTVKEIIGASSTFYKIKNLDLSDNQLNKITDLTWWKSRFPDLEQIILSGNPVDSPQTRAEVRKWYRNLKGYNLLPLDAPLNGALNNALETAPPVPSPSPALEAALNGQILTPAGHPEFPPGSTFGLPVPGKPEDQVLKEQLGLKFSFETRLKMKWVEECLVTNNFDYDRAMNDLNVTLSTGNVPADAFLQV